MHYQRICAYIGCKVRGSSVSMHIHLPKGSTNEHTSSKDIDIVESSTTTSSLRDLA